MKVRDVDNSMVGNFRNVSTCISYGGVEIHILTCAEDLCNNDWALSPRSHGYCSGSGDGVMVSFCMPSNSFMY